MGRKQWIRPHCQWYSLDALIRRTAQTVLLAIVLGASSSAFAGDAEPSAADIATARELFREGAKLAQEQKWEAALDFYQRSMALRPSNLTRYSIAIVQERLGKLVEAKENLRVFLAEDQDRSTFAYVKPAKEMIEGIEQRVARIKIIIPGNPRGAKVFIDGEEIPEAAIGVYRPTDPGDRRIEARVPGYPTFVKTVGLEQGGEAEIVVQLHHSSDNPSDTAVAAPVEKLPTQREQNDNTTGLVLTAAGGGVFVLGLGLGIYGYTKAKDAETSEGSDADSARSMALIGDIGMGVGLVAAGFGTYMLLSDDPPPEPQSGVTVGPWAGPSSAGIVASGRF